MKYDYNSQKIPGVKHVHISKMLYVPAAGFAIIRPTREYFSSLVFLKHNETFGPHHGSLIIYGVLIRVNMVNNPEAIEQLVLAVFFSLH